VLTLQLELQEPECRLASEADRRYVDLRPLDLSSIQPLGAVRPHAAYVARGAISRGQEQPYDLLLDGRTADLWLPAVPAGAHGPPLELPEYPGAGGSCGAAVSPEGGEPGAVRLTGVAMFDDLRLLTKPLEVPLPRENFVAMDTDVDTGGAAWSGVMGLGRLGAAQAGEPLLQALSKATGGAAVASIVPWPRPNGAFAPSLVLGAGIESMCQTTVLWADAEASVPGAAEGEWVVSLEVTVGAFQWRGHAAIDLTSALLRVPEAELPQVLAALLGDEGAAHCVQTGAAPADADAAGAPPVASGLILCPCEAAAARPPLRLAVGASELPVPWQSLLQPVVGQAGLCLLRVHAAARDELPGVGAALLGDHVLALDFDEERVGLCVARRRADAAAEASTTADARAAAAAERTTAAGTAVAAAGSRHPTAAAPAEGPEEVSWLGRLGHVPIALLVITISSAPAVLLSAYKRTQRTGRDQFGRRPVWKVDAGSDSGEDSDGLG